MNIAVRPGSVILSKDEELSASVECINCSLQFFPSSLENATISICSTCDELFNRCKGSTEENESDEDANNVSYNTLLISIPFFLFI
jgi:hypothetical protein